MATDTLARLFNRVGDAIRAHPGHSNQRAHAGGIMRAPDMGGGGGASAPDAAPFTKLNAAGVRKLLKDELAGTDASGKTAFSHQIKGLGSVATAGIAVRLVDPKFSPEVEISATGGTARKHLGSQLPAIRAKLEKHGYNRIKVDHPLDESIPRVKGVPAVFDQTRVTAIYADRRPPSVGLTGG